MKTHRLKNNNKGMRFGSHFKFDSVLFCSVFSEECTKIVSCSNKSDIVIWGNRLENKKETVEVIKGLTFLRFSFSFAFKQVGDRATTISAHLAPRSTVEKRKSCGEKISAHVSMLRDKKCTPEVVSELIEICVVTHYSGVVRVLEKYAAK